MAQEVHGRKTTHLKPISFQVVQK